MGTAAAGLYPQGGRGYVSETTAVCKAIVAAASVRVERGRRTHTFTKRSTAHFYRRRSTARFCQSRSTVRFYQRRWAVHFYQRRSTLGSGTSGPGHSEAHFTRSACFGTPHQDYQAEEPPSAMACGLQDFYGAEEPPNMAAPTCESTSHVQRGEHILRGDMSTSNVCESCDEECVICITAATDGDGDVVRLSCSHIFHVHCFQEYATRRLSDTPARRCTCPTCSSLVTTAELRRILNLSSLDTDTVEAVAAQHAADEAASEVGVVVSSSTAAAASSLAAGKERKAFVKWARTSHIKTCINCSAPIQKNGGCNHMQCASCGANFSWSLAPLLHQCSGYHYSTKFPYVHRCPHQPDKDFTMARGKAAFLAQCGLISLPTAALLFVPCVVLRATKEVCKAHERSCERRRRLEICQAASAALEAERSIVLASCRNGNHPWVLGWCPNCGATTTTTQQHIGASNVQNTCNRRHSDLI